MNRDDIYYILRDLAFCGHHISSDIYPKTGACAYKNGKFEARDDDPECTLRRCPFMMRLEHERKTSSTKKEHQVIVHTGEYSPDPYRYLSGKKKKFNREERDGLQVVLSYICVYIFSTEEEKNAFLGALRAMESEGYWKVLSTKDYRRLRQLNKELNGNYGRSLCQQL